MYYILWISYFKKDKKNVKKKDFYLIDEEKYSNLIKFNPERKLEEKSSNEIKVEEITKKTNHIQKDNLKKDLTSTTKSILKK